MTGRIDLDVAHSRGESEKHLGDGVIDEVFVDKAETKRLLHWKYDSKWGKSGDPANPNITKIYESDSNDPKLRDTGLELRRCARNCLKPMELWSTCKTETLVAVIETIPVKDPSSNSTNTIIYSPEPSFSGQVPTSGKNKAVTNNGILSTLYPRAIIKKQKKQRTNYFEYFTDIETIESEAIDTDGRLMEASLTNPSSPICYATEEVPGPTGPQTVIRKKKVSPSTAAAASLVYSKDKSLSMTIAKGIDPCLIVCIASDMLNRKFISDSNGQQELCLAGCCSAFCC